MCEFGKNAKDEASQSFFGQNEGELGELSVGILERSNVLQKYCERIDMMSPYFKRAVFVINLD
jgi:hypothetical protein